MLGLEGPHKGVPTDASPIMHVHISEPAAFARCGSRLHVRPEGVIGEDLVEIASRLADRAVGDGSDEPDQIFAVERCQVVGEVGVFARLEQPAD